MSSVYIDLEYDHNGNVIEIGAIHIKNNVVQDECHHFINQHVIASIAYYRCAENSHCIPTHTLSDDGISLKKATTDFEFFISGINNPFTIKGHGEDVNENNLKLLFPFLNKKDYSTKITYEQVTLPPWEQRQFEPSHIVAGNMKRGSRLMSCQPYNHKATFRPHWKRQGRAPNHSQLASCSYGYHCALIDAYELAFFEKTLPYYCCDLHFKEHIAEHD
jgi:hypothetical protein